MTLIWLQAQREKRELNMVRKSHLPCNELPSNPLISITIATYNRANILTEITLPSVFQQTYQNFEIVIVGDHCTDDTERRLQALGDPRIRFINLPVRGTYPKDRLHRWMVAGSTPLNVALGVAHGDWIAHLDDDDCFHPKHLEKMLEFTRASSVEMAYSKQLKEFGPDDWRVLGSGLPVAEVYESGRIPHSCAFFRSYLRMFQFNTYSWRLHLAVDHHVWLRMSMAGVSMGFLDEITVDAPLRPGTSQTSELSEDRS